MVLHVYSFKDKFLKAYSQPFYVEVGPQTYATSMKRSILSNEDDSKIAKIKGTALYCLGEFDDETGTFSCIAPELLLDVDDIVAEKKLIDGAKNG